MSMEVKTELTSGLTPEKPIDLEEDAAVELEQLKFQVFSNYVIMRRFFGHLVSGDLIRLRSVCKLWDALCCYYLAKPNVQMAYLYSQKDMRDYLHTIAAGILYSSPFRLTSFSLNIWDISAELIGAFVHLVAPYVKIYFLQGVESNFRFPESSEAFMGKDIILKLFELLRPAKGLQALHVKSDFEILFSSQTLESLPTFKELKTLEVSYFSETPEFNENLIQCLVPKAPFLESLSINLHRSYSTEFIATIPTILQIPRKRPLLSLQVTLTPSDAKAVREMAAIKDCRIRTLVVALKNPLKLNPQQFLQNLTSLLEAQAETLETFGIFALDHSAVPIDIPVLKKLRTLKLLRGPDLRADVVPLSSDQFPMLESVDLTGHEYRIFQHCRFPSVRFFAFSGDHESSETEEWDAVFPNVKTLDIFDTSASQGLLKRCLVKMTQVESLRIRMNASNEEHVGWNILTGGVDYVPGTEVPTQFPTIDPEVPSLSHMTELKELTLSNASISDVEALVYMSVTGNCPILRKLIIRLGPSVWQFPHEYAQTLNKFHLTCTMVSPMIFTMNGND